MSPGNVDTLCRMPTCLHTLSYAYLLTHSALCLLADTPVVEESDIARQCRNLISAQRNGDMTPDGAHKKVLQRRTSGVSICTFVPEKQVN